MPGGPADKAVKGARIDAHDKILEVDGKPVTSKTLPLVRRAQGHANAEAERAGGMREERRVRIEGGRNGGARE